MIPFTPREVASAQLKDAFWQTVVRKKQFANTRNIMRSAISVIPCQIRVKRDSEQGSEKERVDYLELNLQTLEKKTGEKPEKDERKACKKSDFARIGAGKSTLAFPLATRVATNAKKLVASPLEIHKSQS